MKTPDGRDLLIESDELLSDLTHIYGHSIHLLQSWSGIFDSMDISIITVNTLRSLEAAIHCSLDPRRFRPNILVEAWDDRPFPEDRWIGELLVFGERNDAARIRVNRKDLRCMVVNLDPETAEQNPMILKLDFIHFEKQDEQGKLRQSSAKRSADADPAR